MKKTMSRNISFCVVAILVLCMLPCNINQIKTVQADDNYITVWEEQFNGDSLDRSIWNVEQNGDGGGNQELQYYRDSRENIEVSNGTLKIRGLAQGYGGKGYTSGRINTKGKAEFRYGKIEARMKLPKFQGAWPAFWTLGGNHSEIGWPRCGEIDIMEAINTENFTHGALHWYGEGKRDSSAESLSALPENFERTDWHVYGMEWTKTEIKMTVDGKTFFTEPITDGYMGEFRKEHFIILNLAIGGQWPGFSVDNSKFPVTMEVDFVRVSQKSSEKNIVKGSGVPEKSPIIIPEKKEIRNVIEYRDSWNVYFNTAVVEGSGSSTDSSGFKADIRHLGSKGRLINASIRGIDYISGNTYQYQGTFLSDKDKYIAVKVTGEDTEEDIFANYIIFLQAGVPYHFCENVTIRSDYDERVDLVVEMGGRIGGEYLDTDTSLTITMTDASFIGEAEALDEIPTKKPQQELPDLSTEAEDNFEKSTTKSERTSLTGQNKEKVPASELRNFKKKKGKIVSVKRKKQSIRIKIKKVSKAQGYQIRYSVNRKIKRYKAVNTKKLQYTIKKIKKKKTYYIKVRAYRKSGGRFYYSAWSGIKKVKP